MRKSLVFTAGATVFGAVVGAVSALVLWLWHQHGHGGSFGWYSYSGAAPRRYVDYAPALERPSTDWVGLLLPAAVGGAVAGLLLGVVGYLIYRRRAPSRVVS